MHMVVGGIQSFFSGLFCQSHIDDAEETPEQKHQCETYVKALFNDCLSCTQTFEKTDYLARTIISTECCPHVYLHVSCLAEIAARKTIGCPICHKEFDEESNRTRWNAVVDRIHTKALTELGLRDQEVALEVAANDLKEIAARKAREERQIQEDRALALTLEARQD